MTSLAIQGNSYTYGTGPYMADGSGVGKVINRIKNIAKKVGDSKIISQTARKIAPFAGYIPGGKEAVIDFAEKAESIGAGKKRMMKRK